MPVKDVHEIAGHALPSTTLNIYNQHLHGSERRVARVMGELLDRAGGGRGQRGERSERAGSARTETDSTPNE